MKAEEKDIQENYLNTLDCIDKSRDSVLHKMYVSNVGNRLREMETPSDIDCQRWPWELMQNAKDSISGTDRNSVEIILEINEDRLFFNMMDVLLMEKHIWLYYINIQRENQIIQKIHKMRETI